MFTKKKFWKLHYWYRKIYPWITGIDTFRLHIKLATISRPFIDLANNLAVLSANVRVLMRVPLPRFVSVVKILSEDAIIENSLVATTVGRRAWKIEGRSTHSRLITGQIRYLPYVYRSCAWRPISRLRIRGSMIEIQIVMFRPLNGKDGRNHQIYSCPRSARGDGKDGRVCHFAATIGIVLDILHVVIAW